MLNSQNDLNELLANEKGPVSVAVSVAKSNVRPKLASNSPGSYSYRRSLVVTSAGREEAFGRGGLGSSFDSPLGRGGVRTRGFLFFFLLFFPPGPSLCIFSPLLPLTFLCFSSLQSVSFIRFLNIFPLFLFCFSLSFFFYSFTLFLLLPLPVFFFLYFSFLFFFNSYLGSNSHLIRSLFTPVFRLISAPGIHQQYGFGHARTAGAVGQPSPVG